MRNALVVASCAILFAAVGVVSLGAQQSITVEGTLVDSKCYLGMGEKDDDHGNMANCGQMCLKMGQPAGIVTADDAFHALVAPASALAAHVGHTMRVTGTLHNGTILATKVEMNNNGTYTEVKIDAMM